MDQALKFETIKFYFYSFLDLKFDFDFDLKNENINKINITFFMFLQTIENVSCKSRNKNVKKIKFQQFSFKVFKQFSLLLSFFREKVRLIFIISKYYFITISPDFFIEKIRKIIG